MFSNTFLSQGISPRTRQLKEQRLWAPSRQGVPPAEPLNSCEPRSAVFTAAVMQQWEGGAGKGGGDGAGWGPGAGGWRQGDGEVAPWSGAYRTGAPFWMPPGLEGAPLSAASGRMLTLGSSHCLHPLELVPLCPWGFCFGAGLFLLGQVVCGRLDLFSQESSKSPGVVVIRTSPRRAIPSSPSLLQVRGVCDHLSRGV